MNLACSLPLLSGRFYLLLSVHQFCVCSGGMRVFSLRFGHRLRMLSGEIFSTPVPVLSDFNGMLSLAS